MANNLYIVQKNNKLISTEHGDSIHGDSILDKYIFLPFFLSDIMQIYYIKIVSFLRRVIIA